MNLKSNPTLKSSKIKVGLTMGDPSGIGPAITQVAIHKLKELAEFVVIGDEWVFKQSTVHRLQFTDIRFIDLNNVSRKNFEFGKVRAEYGRASIEYLDKALELMKKKEIECLVTCPISKEAINLAGFSYSGHTEYLAKHTGTKEYAMLLLNKNLKISLVTRHIPLKEVSSKINKDALYKTIFLTCRGLKQLFGIGNPRVIICGLNPHASDNGLIGEEENRIIKPVLEELKTKFKMRIDGPVSADSAIFKANMGEYDAVVAMYHDQALIPLKLNDNNSGVNLTLGLPFVRTSPLHGTAFDIARGGPKNFSRANPNSLIEAIALAVRCTLNLKKG